MRGLIWLLLVTFVSAAIVFWLFFAGSTPPPSHSPATSTQSSGAPAEPAIPAPEISTSEPAPEPSPEPAAPPLIVDSFPDSAQPSAEGWARVGDVGGHFDVLVLQSTGTPVASGFPVAADEVVVAQGWAGDHTLGIRFPDVQLTMCGRFVARAQVSRPRPDVGEAVHPNLGSAGWSAEIYAGDLPSCENPVLEAWAMVPGRTAALAPLVGNRQMNITPAPAMREHVSAQVPVDPNDYWPYKAVQINVTASRANMRRCGSTSCSVVAQVDRGTYTAAMLDQVDGWTLVVIGDRAGWLFDELYQTAN